ncbi:hypothetical protein NH14_023255 [Paraburkholderia sacchari]|uniref:Enoyl-CoA hydratase/isomerase domain-containing protein n=1 Tax=Paraburkholderia sacchari TaxID=159450 RepID=A0A8T6ZIF5_9BURK|nr:hypothetical protein [Paraburkholderia sacchari]
MENRPNHAIFSYPKPYIALINGVVMGGTARMAMSETRIGFFPRCRLGRADCGGALPDPSADTARGAPVSCAAHGCRFSLRWFRS